MADTIFIPDLPQIEEVNDNTTFVSDSGAETNSVKAPQVADYVKKNTTPNDIGAMPSDRIIVNPNLLDNGDFQIWQRGESFSLGTGNFPTADRYNIFTQGNAEVIKDENWLKCTVKNDAINAINMLIEVSPEWLGKTMTLSFDVKASEVLDLQTFIWNGYNLTNVMQAFYWTANTSKQRYSFTFTVPTVLTDNILYLWFVRMNNMNGKSVWLTNCKLEVGNVATPFYPTNYAEELFKCQRYQVVVGNELISIRNNVYTTNQLYFDIPLPRELRANPSIENTITIRDIANNEQTGFTFTYQKRIGMNYMRVIATKANHGLTDAVLVFGTPHVIINASL